MLPSTLQNRFFDPSILSMRKGRDGENGKNTSLVPSGEGGTRSPPATQHRLQNPKWPTGSGKVSTSRFLLEATFVK